MNEEQKYIDFESYERVAEPHKRERVSAWRTAIGLQDVDGLRVSEYLKETAVKHIEGDITIDEVREQLRSYYVNKTTHDAEDAKKEVENGKTEFNSINNEIWGRSFNGKSEVSMVEKGESKVSLIKCVALQDISL